MASGSERDDEGIPLDIDNVLALLQVEHEQIQKRTFTNWINAQLAKRCSPSYVSDLFLDLRDGSRLLDLLEVMSGHSMQRQRGRGLFQQRANIETALNFLKKKSIKLVNINISDIIDGRPSIILGLVWNIILHCHIEELASVLSFSSRHSSLDSLVSVDSQSGSPIPASPVPAGRISPLHRRFRISAKKGLLMWVRDQIKKVHCTVNVKDFRSSWRSGEAFLAILCSLRPELVDLSLVHTRSNQENLEEAFHLAERELHIPRLLEPQDVDVRNPDEKSIMTYVTQFLQYSNDMPSPDDHLQMSPRKQAQDVTCLLQQTYQELSEAWTATQRSTYVEKYQVYERLTASLAEQRRSVISLLAATRHRSELHQEQQALKTALDQLEEKIRRFEADLEQSLPPPLDSVVLWLQNGEAALKEEGGTTKDPAEAAKHARAKQNQLKTIMKEMNHYLKLTDTYHKIDASGNATVPPVKLDNIKNRLTGIRVTTKYELIKLEYEESHHTVLDLLGKVRAKVESWRAPYGSQESVQFLLLDWHETVEPQGFLFILIDALQGLKDKMNVYTSKASLGGDFQHVTRQVKEAENKVELVKQKTAAVKETMERVASAWNLYNESLASLEARLAQTPAAETQDMSEWTSRHAQLNETGNFLIEMTEASISLCLVKQLSKVNMRWAECMKKTVFETLSEPKEGSISMLMLDSLIQEASLLMKQPLEIASVPLKAVRQKLQSTRAKIGEVDLSCSIPSAELQTTYKENVQQTLLKLVEAERSCGDLQRAASQLEGFVAELNHWNTEGLDCCTQLMEKKPTGRPSALDSAAKALISRGVQLVQQAATEWQNLEDFVTEQQKTSSLQHLSTTDMQDRIVAAVSQGHGILEKLSSCGFKHQVGDLSKQMQPFETLPPENGSCIQARMKHVKLIANVKLQIQEMSKFPDQGTKYCQDSKQSIEEREGSLSLVAIKTGPQPTMVPVLKNQRSAQTESPAPSAHAAGSDAAEAAHSLFLHGQNIELKSRKEVQPDTDVGQTHTQPPLMIHSEVHSKAQSMARSRLEKARLRLQGRIQQAMNLFGGRELTVSQFKKKQKALNILQPAMLEEFLGAVEALGAFCSGPQLQDLMLLSDSVQNQWEDVRREMAEFISIQGSIIREIKQPISVGEHFTNALHEATDQQAITQGAAAAEDSFESLRELSETLTSEKSSSLSMDHTRPNKVQNTETTFLPKSRGQQLEVNTPLRAAEMQVSSRLTSMQGLDRAQQDNLPLGRGVHAQRLGHSLQLGVQNVPSGNQDHLMQSQGEGCEKKQKPSLQAKEQLLRARLLHLTESSQQTPRHIQAVVRRNTVENKQEAEWTVIPGPAVPPQLEHSTNQAALGSRMVLLKNTSDSKELSNDQRTVIAERLKQIIKQPLEISSLVLVNPKIYSELKEIDETLKDEMRRLSEQSAEEEMQGPGATSQPFLCQPLLSNVYHLQQLRQQLEDVQSTVEALDHFLATLRDIKAGIPMLLANQYPKKLKKETDPDKEGHSWQATIERRKSAMEQSHIIDCNLKAVGITLTMDGASVKCCDVVDSVPEQIRARRQEEDKEEDLLGKKDIQTDEDMDPMETQRSVSPKQDSKQSATRITEEESVLGVLKEGDNEAKLPKDQGHRSQTMRSAESFLTTKDQAHRSISGHAWSVMKDENEDQNFVQRRSALLALLRETKTKAERLGLQEATLPGLRQRTCALTELESFLASVESELQYLRDAFSKSEIPEENRTREMEDLWEETTKATSERLEQSHLLTELLRRFQSMCGELNCVLQKAETTLAEQASYIGKDYLLRLYTKVKETKAELNGLGDNIEEVRSICRQLQSLLRQIPGCNATPYESEADALMDRWLDLSERTDSHLENLHLCLTLWDGVLQLGAEVESWTSTRIAVLSQCPCFQAEDDITALQNEIMTQEESIQRFHQRAAEIQSLLQSAEPPLELQVVETQMRKNMKQLKELSLESEEVFKQTLATLGQITERIKESLRSLQKIEDSLQGLSGPDVATVLAKLKGLGLKLRNEEEQAQLLLEDVQVLASIASPASLQSLSLTVSQLEVKIRNTHQLFSEIEEQTERNIQNLNKLQIEKEHLEMRLHAAEENALKVKDLTLLQEEAQGQREKTELIAELVSFLKSSNLQQCLLLEESCELLEQCHNFYTTTGRGLEEVTPMLSNDFMGFQGLVQSIQSWIEDLRQNVESPVVDGGEIAISAEQSLHRAQVVLNSTAEAEARLEELRVTGGSLSQGLLDREDLKQEIQVTIKETEEQWKSLLESVQPYYRALQEDFELISHYLTSTQEARCKLEELRNHAEQLPSLFPWPGTAERAKACLLARQLQTECKSQKLTLTNLDEKRTELAEKNINSIWRDSSWGDLETHWSALMAEVKGLCINIEKGLSAEEQLGQILQGCHHHLTTIHERMTACQAQKESSGGLTSDEAALEALLKQIPEIEKDLLGLLKLRDSLTTSSTAEAQASLSEEVCNLQNHKRAIEYGIKEHLQQTKRLKDEGIQEFWKEASLLQTDITDLATQGDELSMLPDIYKLTQQWCAIQEWDQKVKELELRGTDLQRMREALESLPAEPGFTASAVSEELLSLRLVLIQKKQECVETTAETVKGLIRDLQQWIRTVQVQTSPPSQAAMDEGLRLQQVLSDVISQQNILKNCLGEEVTKTLIERVFEVLDESQKTSESISKSLARPSSRQVKTPKRGDKGCLKDEGVTMCSDSAKKAGDVCSPASSTTKDKKDLNSLQDDNEMESCETFTTLTKQHTCPSAALKDKITTTKLNQENILVCSTATIMEVNKGDALASTHGQCSESPDVLEPSTSREANSQISVEPKEDEDPLSCLDVMPFKTITETFTSTSVNTEASQKDCTSPLVSELADSDNVGKLPVVTSIKEATQAAIPAIHSIDDSLSIQSDTSVSLKEKHPESTTNVFSGDLEMQSEKTQQLENTGACSPNVPTYSQEEELTQFTENTARFYTESARQESDKMFLKTGIKATESEKSEAGMDAGDEHNRQGSRSPDKVFTIVLGLQSFEVQQSGYIGAGCPDGFRWSDNVEHRKENPEEYSNTDFLGTKQTFSPELGSESTLLVSRNVEQKDSSTQLQNKENQTYSIIMDAEAQALSRSCFTDTSCKFGDQHSAETTFPVSETELTISQFGEKTEIPAQCCADDFVPNKDETETKMQVGAIDKQLTVTDTAVKTGGAGEGAAQGGAGESECTAGKQCAIPAVQESTSLLNEEWTSTPNGVQKEMLLQLGMPKSHGNMEPDRITPRLTRPGAEELTGGSPGTYNYSSTLQESLSKIQDLVEQSHIIQRTSHMDLMASPGVADLRLARTVQNVLACRYQPAQLNAKAMENQFEEAQDYKRSVMQQVAAIKSNVTEVSEPNDLEKAEGEFNSALLDASATIQVKAAQLNQVKQYHMQKKIIRAFLDVIAAEKEKMSLSVLGSSSLQAEKLYALLQTMEQKKSMIEDLLHLSSQLSVHLSDADSSGVLLAQLADIQEEWRVLQGSIKRAHQQASNSACQSKIILKDTGELKAKLETLLDFKAENIDPLDLVCLTTDLKVYNQLYFHLKSQADALICFSLGQQEQAAIEELLHNLESLLCITKKKLNSLGERFEGKSTRKINKQLRDLITLTKQVGNRVFTMKKLSAFPEQARFQIAEIKRLQMETLSGRNKMEMQVKELKSAATKMENEDYRLMKTEDLYENVADMMDRILKTMKMDLDEREKLLCEFASLDEWIAEKHAKNESIYVESVLKANLCELETQLKSHQSAAVEVENQLKSVDALSESCTTLAINLNPGEGRYLINRLSGLWAALDGLLAHERATSWELEEQIHKRKASNEELCTIQANLKKTSADLKKQNFPFTKETLSIIRHWEHMLMEHQWEVQELQHCQEDQRNSVLCSIGELQDQCKVLRLNAVEHGRYLHLRGQIEESMQITERQIQEDKSQSVSNAERLRLCQALLVELAFVKSQCQGAADQLEATAYGLQPSELNLERKKLHQIVETLICWEYSFIDEINHLEAELLPGLKFTFEFPALMELLQKLKDQLEDAQQFKPDNVTIEKAMLQCWVIRRTVESGMRVLECLAQKDNINLEDYSKLFSLKDAVLQKCHSRTVSLSQAREYLKDYQRAAQGAIGFLQNAEATVLSALAGILDCTQGKTQIRKALEVLEDGFQSQICHLTERVPQHCCLSWADIEVLHISILSPLLVGKVLLEAQAELRLECLQRFEKTQETHRMWHEDIKQEVWQFEAKLLDCSSKKVASFDECITQRQRAKVLNEDLRNLAGKMVDLRAGCPTQGCGDGKDGEVGTLWRHWPSLRRSVGLLLTHTEGKEEEWKDITTSMEESCSYLVGLQAELPDSSTFNFSQKEPQELLAQVEQHHAGLEQKEQDLLSLKHRLKHTLGSTSSQKTISPGPIGEALENIQESISSFKEKSQVFMVAAEQEEKERWQIQEEMQDIEKDMFAILPELEICSNPSKKQELQQSIIYLRGKFKRIIDTLESRYAEIPADIKTKMQNVEQSVQNAEEMVSKCDDPVWKLSRRVKDLGSGLERVKTLLEQKSPTIGEAQNALKGVWDELDAWHSSIMLLESEVQELAEDQPYEAQLLMDQLTEPLQLYQNASRSAESRTAFLSKIPACLQEFEDISQRASCWLDEAQFWLHTPCLFTTAKSLHNHVKHLQLVLDDSDRIRHTLQVFKSVLAEISEVCDVSRQEEGLDQRDQQVQEMQQSVVDPLDQLQQAAAVVEVVEVDIKGMEKNVSNIRTILDSMDDAGITKAELIVHCEDILTQIEAMQERLEDMKTWKGEVHLPKGVENLVVFSKARLLLEQLDELDQITRDHLSLLENRQDAGTAEKLDAISVPDLPKEMQLLDNPVHRRFFQDLEEMSYLSDERREDMSEVDQEVESTTRQENCSEEPGTKPGLHSSFASQNTGPTSPKLDSKADTSQTVSPEILTVDDPRESSKEMNSSLVGAGTGDTRMIPSRPITPFSTKNPSDDVRDKELEEEVKHLRLNSADLSDSAALNRLKEQEEVSLSPMNDCAASHKSEKFPETGIGSPGHEDDEVEENRRWSLLCTHMSKKLSSLRNVSGEQRDAMITQDGGERRMVPGEEPVSTGSVSFVLQQVQDTVVLLKQMLYEARPSGSSHPEVKKKLYKTARRVIFCLDSSADLLTHDETFARDPQLRLLQQETLSVQLVTLAELVNKVELQMKAALLTEESDADNCLSSLEDYLHVVQLLLSSSHNQLLEHSGLQNQHQMLPSNVPYPLVSFDIGNCEIFPNANGVSTLECELGRYLRASAGGKEELQLASQSLLQGIARLLKQGEESLTEKWTSPIPNRSKLQAVLSRRKKLLQVLGSQLSFLQYLIQHEPNALKSKEDEWVHLQVKAKALQQQILEEEVSCQKKLQDWIHWEHLCGQLGTVLEESEAFISSGEAEGNYEEEEMVEQRLHSRKKTLLQLDESRAVLGTLLDRRAVLQAEPWFGASVGQAGGVLVLRWQGAYRRIEHEILRLRKIHESRTRFQTDFTLVRERLLCASKHLKTLSDLTDSSDLNQESVQRRLVELLDLSLELEATSAQTEAVSKEAILLLHLRSTDCAVLRDQTSQLETSCIQLNSDYSKTMENLLQCQVAAQPPQQMSYELEDWLKKMETRLRLDRERIVKANNAAEIAEILKHCQVLKKAVDNCQQLLDFMSQPGCKTGGADVHADRLERTTFAEHLGSITLQWLLLQRELVSQIHEVEHIHHTCAERERRLQRLHSWTEKQKKRMAQWRHPSSQTLARSALQELQADCGKIKEVSAAVQELEKVRVNYGQEENFLFDVNFSEQTKSVSQACGNLYRQMEDLRPGLEEAVEKWTCFQGALRDATLYATRVRCNLQHQQAPFFSLQQVEGYSNLIQDLQVKVAAEGEQFCTAVDQSYRRLSVTLHDGSAQALSDQVEEQRTRWKEILQEIRDQHKKIREISSLWLEYSKLSKRVSHRLQHLWNKWEELSSSSSGTDAEATVCSFKKLQDAAEELQNDAGDVLAASKGLLGQLEPLAANVFNSEARLLTRNILLLNQVISRKMKNLEEELDQKIQFKAQLEALEEQMQNSLSYLYGGTCDADTLEQVHVELGKMIPSLVAVKEMSGNITINNEAMERAQLLNRQWVEFVIEATHQNGVLQNELKGANNFEEKCAKLNFIQQHLEQESLCSTAVNHSNLQEMLTAHQKFEVEVISGEHVLQSLLCDAVKSMERENGEKRSELMVRVLRLKRGWADSVAEAAHNWSFAKEHLLQWRTYHHGSTSLKKLLREVDSFLPPTELRLYTMQQLQNCMNLHQLIEDSLGLHSSVYTRTLEAGKHLCEIITESESKIRLQSELQGLQKAWERTTLQQRRNKDLVKNVVQMWSRTQEAAGSIVCGLDKVDHLLAQSPEHSREEVHIKETELSLQHLAHGLRDLATMKTDLSQYVAASDSALLEQQLELLHAQWDELCTKVSLRRQEMSDRLNAWTIFNDKNKEFCDWLTQMENKVCHSADLTIEEMVEKLKKDCMEEINLFSENKSHLKQLGEQLLLASDEAKQTQVCGSLQKVNQRWNNLFQHVEARVKKLKETLVTMQQLDKNMSNLRSWLSRIEAELSRPITYSVCHENEIQKRLTEQQDLQRDMEHHTEGVASVLSLCDVLLQDEDAVGGTELESDSLQETSHSLDQRWRTICALALDRRLRIEETWTLWCKFLKDYSRFEDWLKMAERTVANPNSADVLYSVAKEELKKFEGFQRQVYERLTQLELINNQYRRLSRENRTDRASQLKAMVREGNQRWDGLHRRVAAILRRLKYFTSQREEFQSARESMLVWLTELDLQLTNVEHFSESDVHQKIQQLNSFQKEITLNTERIDGLIVFGEALIQRSSPQDAALIEDELEELHSYCQEVFSRLVRFHQRLSTPPMTNEEPDSSDLTFSLESSIELIGRPWLGRSQMSLPATPTHLFSSPLERSGRETPVSIDSLPLEWDHTGDVGGSSSHEDDEEEEDLEDGVAFFSALSVSTRSLALRDCSSTDAQQDPEGHAEPSPTLTSTPLKQGYLQLMSQCSGSIENLKRVSLILDDDDERPEEFGLTGLNASDKQSGVIERWELFRAQSRCSQQSAAQDPQQMTFDLDDITSWLESVIPELERLTQSEPSGGIEGMEGRAKELKEMDKEFCHYKAIMLSVNLQSKGPPELEERLARVNIHWSRACTKLQEWDHSLRKKLMRCQEFHETLHSLLLWLSLAESRCYAVDIKHPQTSVTALKQQQNHLRELREELHNRQAHLAPLQALWSQLQPPEDSEDSNEAEEKLHVTGNKLKQLERKVDEDLGVLQQRMLTQDTGCAEAETTPESACSKGSSFAQRQRREPSQPRSFFYRLLRAIFPLQILLLLLLLLPCIIPLSEDDPSCTVSNNFARSFYPMLHYTNGPPPT